MDSAIDTISKSLENMVKVDDSFLHGLGLFNNLKGQITPGQVVSVVAFGEPDPIPHSKRCCRAGSRYLTWDPVTRQTSPWKAGAAANECTKGVPINAVLKGFHFKPAQRNGNSTTETWIMTLVACATIPKGHEIVTYYGNGWWPHRSV
jgi:hypothetical protein